MKVKEITPLNFMCVGGGCPTVFEIVDENKLVIVGSKVNIKKIGLAKRVGKDEEAVIVDKEMFRQIFEK